MLEVQNYIGGEFVGSVSHVGERFEVYDPSTDSVYATLPMSYADDVDAAVNAAAKAFKS